MTIADVLSGAKRWHVEQGDCLDVMRSIPDQSIDHVITDPPYEAEAHTKQRRSGRGDHSSGLVGSALDFDPMDPATRWACGREWGRLTKRWCLIFCQLEGVRAWRDAGEHYGLEHRRSCIWVKPDGMPQFTGDRPGTGYEVLEAMHAKGRSRWNGGGRRGVFTFNCGSQVRDATDDHQTQKPLDLMLELVELFTDPGDVILDSFAGSGSTIIAALRLGRRAIGIERSPKYHALTVARVEAEVNGSTLRAARAGQGALFGGAR